MSNGCAPVWASYSAINRFTSSMSAVSGSYSRRVVSPTGENVRILAFTFGLLQAFFGGFLGRVGLVLVILHRVLGLSRGRRNGRLLVQECHRRVPYLGPSHLTTRVRLLSIDELP